MSEEAEEVLHDETERVLGYHGILHVGQFLLVQLLDGSREVIVVADEVEGRHLVNIAIQNEIDHSGEMTLLVAFLVYHDRLEEGMRLVERHEPMCLSPQILAVVEQGYLGEIDVEAALEAVSQVSSAQGNNVLDVVGIHCIFAREQFFRDGFRLSHFLLQVLFGDEHQQEFVLHLNDLFLPFAGKETFG